MGWGVVERVNGKDTFCAAGCIETPSSDERGTRLLQLANELETLLHTYAPTAVGIESLLFTTNVTTGIRVSEARGVALLMCKRAGLEAHEFSPTEVKSATTGSGAATKAQMKKLISAQLHLSSTPWPDDAIDALAIALCTAHTHGSLGRTYR
jgi:crossover junction endodeoxyribonuclease RuvC